MDELLNQTQLRDRTEEIKQIIERLDVRWDNGSVSKDEYLQKRKQLREELEGLQPLPRAMLEESLRVFPGFRKIWEANGLYQRKHLLGLILEKVWVKGNEISAITLRPSCHLVISGLRKAAEDSGLLNPDGTPKDGDGKGSTVDGEQTPQGSAHEKTSQQLTIPLDGYTGATGVGYSAATLSVILVAAPPLESGFCFPYSPAATGFCRSRQEQAIAQWIAGVGPAELTIRQALL